jgi:hypothetical protein
MIVAALLYLLWKQETVGNYLLASLGILGFSFYVTPCLHNQHAVLVMPLTSLILARAAELVARAQVRWRHLIFMTLIAPTLVLYISGDVSLMWRSQMLSYLRYAQALRQFVPAGANVLGEGAWWFEFYDGTYTFDSNLPDSSLGGSELQVKILNDLRRRQVAYLLYDGRIGSSIEDPYTRPEINFYPLYERFIKENCEQIGEVDLPYIGVERGGPANKHTTVWRCSFVPS